MKKIIALVLAVIMISCVFTGCTNNESNDAKLNIVCTMFPQYDWARNIAGEAENVNIMLLLDSGTDLHSYQPTAADIVTISSADVFIYIGGDSDKWVGEVLETSKNEDTLVINLMESLGEENLYCAEEIAEEHSHEAEEEHNHTHDEHIWLSVKNALRLTKIIAAAIIEKDPENKGTYEENLTSYVKKLDALDKAYEGELLTSENKTLVFADRFPFIYLAKDYGLTCHAAFSGCSAESEASFETVTRLAGKIDELELSYILITETSDGSVANTVKNSTKAKDQQILTLNSLQSVTKDKLSLSYIEVMNENLNVIKTALS